MQRNYWSGDPPPPIKKMRPPKQTGKLTEWREATPEERERSKPVKKHPWWAFWR